MGVGVAIWHRVGNVRPLEGFGGVQRVSIGSQSVQADPEQNATRLVGSGSTRRVIKDAVRKAGVVKRVACQAFGHSFATELD